MPILESDSTIAKAELEIGGHVVPPVTEGAKESAGGALDAPAAANTSIDFVQELLELCNADLDAFTNLGLAAT